MSGVRARKQALFIHNNFPGQFGFLAEAMIADGWTCAAIGSETASPVANLPMARWRTTRGSTPGIYGPATRAEADLIRGRAAAECAMVLKNKGLNPDLVIGHPGWGETLFMEEIFPEARQILHGEFYYRAKGGDVGFDPEFGDLDQDERFRVHAKNATLGLAYLSADRLVCPTRFQASVFPEPLKPRISIIHEGVDTQAIAPRDTASFTLADGRVLDRSTPVITFINRRFEPLRGFHVFMRALPALLKAVPNAQIVLIGSDDGSGYGRTPPEGKTWKSVALEELAGQLDLDRVHFVGRLPHARMLDALAISAAHVYYTYPFVLSWSLLEALASGCLVIGSDTAPVRDAIVSGESGILLDFFDVEALSNAMISACREPELYAQMRKAARAAVTAEFDRRLTCLPRWRALIDETVALGPRS
jgi:glycosyltransferase involved in cell wall biosynthesis